ncbi:hypothetical protein BVRB_7g163490 [Beta vulgaris subsp. vulgaris]|nr:hypothetical protein BVRB_7g163490 [Beta vulgaris subsp. vulgaris]
MRTNYQYPEDKIPFEMRVCSVCYCARLTNSEAEAGTTVARKNHLIRSSFVVDAPPCRVVSSSVRR